MVLPVDVTDRPDVASAGQVADDLKDESVITKFEGRIITIDPVTQIPNELCKALWDATVALQRHSVYGFDSEFATVGVHREVALIQLAVPGDAERPGVVVIIRTPK